MSILIHPVDDLKRRGWGEAEIKRYGGTIDKGHAVFNGPNPGYNAVLAFLQKEEVPTPKPPPQVVARHHRWTKVRDTFKSAVNYASSKASKLTQPPVSPTTRRLRQISCHGYQTGFPEAENRPICPARSFTDKAGGFHFCNECGCGAKLEARLSAVGSTADAPAFLEEDNDKYSYPYLACPRNMPGFSVQTEDVVIRTIKGGLGDMSALALAVRDLQTAYPGRYRLNLRMGWPQLFEHNKYLTHNHMPPGTREVIIQTNIGLYGNGEDHLQTIYTRQLEKLLDLTIPITRIGGYDAIHLSDEEKAWLPPWPTYKPYWILNAGSKADFTVKQSDPAELQKVVDHFRGRIMFVQTGGKDHLHPKIKNAFHYFGTAEDNNIRNVMKAMYRAQGVLTPISGPMHLAAALELPPEMKERHCVVLAGGREREMLYAYPNHKVLENVGELDCCRKGPCWRLKVDVDCLNGTNVGLPLFVPGPLRIAKCMAMLTADKMIERIEACQAS
jgi:hypothetical protein